MPISEVRIYVEIKRKENKTESENLYLKLRDYNNICCNIDISYQKLKYDYDTYKEERKNNYNKYINEELLNSMINIKSSLKLVMGNIKLDYNSLSFEEVLFTNYEKAIENIKKDMELIG